MHTEQIWPEQKEKKSKWFEKKDENLSISKTKGYSGESHRFTQRAFLPKHSCILHKKNK